MAKYILLRETLQKNGFNMRLDVNTDASIKLTAKLEKLHRSAFPSAVRNTLNQVAFEAKKNVPKQAKENFTIRQNNLFNKMSIVNKANGFNVNRMKSVIGLDGSKLPKLAVGLEKQETGGSLKGSKLIAHSLARVSGNSAKKIKKKNYLGTVKNIGTAKKRIKGSKYFRIKKDGKETVFQNISKNKIAPVYNVAKTKTKQIKSKPFIKPSAEKAAKDMESIYKKQAEFQFNKHMR
jgi:hypothetical protein